jgi:hypothetical protein
MGATKIMVIRHAEKPGIYNGKQYFGVNPTGDIAGADGSKHLITTGWQRAGALVTLFAPPWGPKKPELDTPTYLFASDPQSDGGVGNNADDEGPSQRPYETLIPVSAKLRLTTDTHDKKSHYAKMVERALATKDGVVLIAWQHEDIPLLAKDGKQPGISQEILTQTQTTATFHIPKTWPSNPQGASRYDLVFVFDRPKGTGPIVKFSLIAQMLLAGDAPPPQSG